jgi:hypothetical protein
MWVFDRETLQFLAVNDTAIAHYGYRARSSWRRRSLTSASLKTCPPAGEGGGEWQWLHARHRLAASVKDGSIYSCGNLIPRPGVRGTAGQNRAFAKTSPSGCLRRRKSASRRPVGQGAGRHHRARPGPPQFSIGTAAPSGSITGRPVKPSVLPSRKLLYRGSRDFLISHR